VFTLEGGSLNVLIAGIIAAAGHHFQFQTAMIDATTRGVW
jgi:hypothetical protein